MIQSMTGYGKAIVNLPNKKITIEIKSLNSKNLDLNARIPSHYREKELAIRNKVSKALVRGKIDLGLFVEVTGEETSTSINAAVVKEYMRQLAAVSEGADMDHLQMAIRLPDALKTERENINPEEYESILEAIDSALTSLNSYRTNEGADLENDFKKRVENIEKYSVRIMTYIADFPLSSINGVHVRVRMHSVCFLFPIVFLLILFLRSEPNLCSLNFNIFIK